MYQRYKERFGTAGVVIGVIALALALVTGAYAAGGGLSGKQKKEVEKIAKKFAGKDGAPGAAGTNGTNGKDGAAGTNGTNGKSVTVSGLTSPGCEGRAGAEVKTEGAVSGVEVCNGEEGAPGESPVGTPFTGTKTVGSVTCTAGGVSYEVNATGEEQIVCNGQEGSPWTVGSVLPEGIHAEEHGLWSVSTESASTELWGPISFPIRLGTGSNEVHYSTDASYATYCENKGAENVVVKDEYEKEVSPGVFAKEPTPPKTLCVREIEVSPTATYVGVFKGNRASTGLGPVGAWMKFTTTGAGHAFGVWALQG